MDFFCEAIRLLGLANYLSRINECIIQCSTLHPVLTIFSSRQDNARVISSGTQTDRPATPLHLRQHRRDDSRTLTR